MTLVTPPRTVVETRTFLANAKDVMTETEREEFIGEIAMNPEAGDVIPGTGGFRKVRVGIGGRGKRGGARVVYYFAPDDDVPVILIAAFAKNVRADPSQAERNALRTLAPLLLAGFRKGG